MKVSLLLLVLYSVITQEISGSFLDNVKSFVANPNLAGSIMKLYINLRLGNEYQTAYPNLADHVKFRLYTRKHKTFSEELIVGDSGLLDKSSFDPSKPTFFVVHGFLNNLYMPAIQTIKGALLEDFDCNVVAVDWGRIAITLSYPVAAAETQYVGAYVAEMVKFLASAKGLDLRATHLIGHSLGAQICGFAGKNLQGMGLARITGLDPALPGFGDQSPEGRLDATDAAFVDCIYTCAGALGFKNPICKANFYPNGGQKQPGCLIDINGICSHLRVIDLFAESVSPKSKFEAYQCGSVPDSTGTDCSSTSSAIMGYHTDTSLEGIFFVKTNRKSKYALIQE